MTRYAEQDSLKRKAIDLPFPSKRMCINVEKLLDKPFTALTKSEWEIIKVWGYLQQGKPKSEIEIVIVVDVDFGTLFQVHINGKVKGSIHLSSEDGKWVAGFTNQSSLSRFDTAGEAIAAIIKAD